MRNRRLLIVGLAGTLALACTLGSEGPGVESLRATMTPGSENPPVTNAPNASGTGNFFLATDGKSVSYSIGVTGLTGNPTGVHIHGPAGIGVNADLLVPLSAAAITTGLLASGEFNATSSPTVSFDSLLVLIRNGNAYLNVHTSLNPGGEIRGQIVRQ